MKEVHPFTSLAEAKEALDNGGRFYNLLSKRNDGTITAAEVGKVAGLFHDRQQMVLFLELAMAALSAADRESLLRALAEDMLAAYEKHRPQGLGPQASLEERNKGGSLVVKGVPQRIEATSEFEGFIMIPVMVGNVTTFSMIPIYEEYEVYEVNRGAGSTPLIMAHGKQANPLPETSLILAGVIKQFSEDEAGASHTKRFLELVYYRKG